MRSITSLSTHLSSSWQHKLITTLLLVWLGAGSSTALAASITGAFNAGNTYTYTTPDLSTATALDFLSAPLPDPGARDATAGIGTGTGDLATITGSSVGDIVDILNFASFSPVSNFLTIEGFQLDLTTLSVDAQISLFLSLSGTGVLSGNGFDSTPATWTLTAQSVDFGGGVVTPTTYSMTVAAVPVPAAVWLFGSGILGLVAVARRRKTSH